RVNIDKVIIREFLSVQLFEQGIEIAVEGRLLVRVLAVAERSWRTDRFAEHGQLRIRVEIVEDRCVVLCSDIERHRGKPPPVFKIGGALFRLKQGEEFLILGARRYNEHILVVLGGRTNEGYSADIDFFYDLGLRFARCHGFNKRIQVDNHKVNRGDVKLARFLFVLLVAPAVQYSSKYGGKKWC